VAGSMGPTTKLPSLGHITWDAMLAAYLEQAEALIEGAIGYLHKPFDLRELDQLVALALGSGPPATGG